jgi:hypothetical protein
MKTKEFIFEIKKPRVKMPKQRDPNWQTMQAKATSGAGGQHRDEKRAEKLGDVKHKKDLIPMEDQGVAEGFFGIDDKIKGKIQNIVSDLSDIPGMWDHKAQTFTDAGMDKLKTVLKNNPKYIKYALNLDYRDYEAEGVAEASDFGEPREILEDVLRVLEREVEWPLTDVMDPREVKQLLAPIVKAVNDKMMSMEEAFGRKNNYYNPLEYERDQQRQMDYEKQAFKRAELQHELGHEDDPDFERKLRQQQMDKDRGPWYIRIDGKIYKQKGEPKVFDWKKGANNYALAIVKNRPELKDKTVLTRNPVDQ